MSALDQWKNYSKKLNNKVNEMFTQKKEGFSGILGANEEITNLNFNDEADAMANIGQLTQNINTYKSAETILKAKTNEYLNKAEDVTTEKRNYNVFINKHAPVVKIASPARAATSAISSAPANTGEQCISLDTLSTFVDSSNNGFDSAYPANFTFFDKAKAACQAWAADLGYTYSGVTKEQGVFKCYTSYTPPVSSPQYTRPGVLYTVAANPDTTTGGLFSNGQIGVYRSTKNQKWDIQNMQKPFPIKHYNNAMYDYSNRLITAQPFKQAYDNNWFGDSKTDWSPSNMGKNLFDKGKYAWWVGFVKNKEDLKKTWNRNNWYDGIGHDGSRCYFYYVYNSTGAVTANTDVVSSCGGFECPTQGQGARCPAGAASSWNLNWNCNNDKWTVDRGAKSGQIVGIYIVSTYAEFLYNSAGLVFSNTLDNILKINGIAHELTPVITGEASVKSGCYGSSTLAPGKNVFEITMPVGLPNSAFVLYVYDLITKDVLFQSGLDGWGVTTTPVPEWSMVSNIPPTAQTLADPFLFKTVNNEPNGFSTCDKLIGGSINMKTINATLGKNCSTSTKKPLKARYISVFSNTAGDPVQISQLVVMAFLNGIQTNVASRGTVTSSLGIDNIDNRIPLNGKTDNKEFWNSGKKNNNSNINSGLEFWELDLGTEFPLTSITYYNADVNNVFANGMRISLKNGAGTGIHLKTPLELTGQLVQTFNVSEDDIFYGSPNFVLRVPGDTKDYSHFMGYGITSISEAKATCESQGQRMCKKEEIALYDSCAGAWNGFEETGKMGFPMAHGDPYPSGGCGGMKPGQPGFSPWVDWDWYASGVYCCDKDHSPSTPYNPNTHPMRRV